MWDLPEHDTTTNETSFELDDFQVKIKKSQTFKKERNKEQTHSIPQYFTRIIKLYSHYNIHNVQLVTDSNNLNIYFLYVTLYQEALPVSLAIEELQYSV